MKHAQPATAGTSLLSIMIMALVALSILGGTSVVIAQDPPSITVAEGAYLRGTGQPTTESVSFFAWEQDGVLTLYNGGKNGQFDRISSAEVWLNGELVFTQDQFSQDVDILEFPFQAQQENTLELRLASAPGSAVEIEAVVTAPEGTSEIPEAYFLDIAAEQNDQGDTDDLLREYGFSFEYAMEQQDSEGGFLYVAAYRDATGRRALYLINHPIANWMGTAAAMPDGEDVLVFQRPGGLRMSSDGAWTLLNAQEIEDVLTLNSEESSVAATTSAEASTLSSSAVCDSSAEIDNDECSEFLWQALDCVSTAALTVVDCHHCYHIMKLALATTAAAPLSVTAAAVGAFVCTSCFRHASEVPECRDVIAEIGSGCDTGCDCVAAAYCLGYRCYPTELQLQTSVCTPNDPPGCVYGGSGDDWYVGVPQYECDSEGTCEQARVIPCPACRPCEVGENGFGSCDVDPELEGTTCHTNEGEPGICLEGVCDPGMTGETPTIVSWQSGPAAGFQTMQPGVNVGPDWATSIKPAVILFELAVEGMDASQPPTTYADSYEIVTTGHYFMSQAILRDMQDFSAEVTVTLVDPTTGEVFDQETSYGVFNLARVRAGSGHSVIYTTNDIFRRDDRCDPYGGVVTRTTSITTQVSKTWPPGAHDWSGDITANVEVDIPGGYVCSASDSEHLDNALMATGELSYRITLLTDDEHRGVYRLTSVWSSVFGAGFTVAPQCSLTYQPYANHEWECDTDLYCDDSDHCTVDSCTDGYCFYEVSETQPVGHGGASCLFRFDGGPMPCVHHNGTCTTVGSAQLDQDGYLTSVSCTRTVSSSDSEQHQITLTFSGGSE